MTALAGVKSVCLLRCVAIAAAQRLNKKAQLVLYALVHKFMQNYQLTCYDLTAEIDRVETHALFSEAVLQLRL